MSQNEAKRQLNLAEKFNSLRQAQVFEEEVRKHESELRLWKALQKSNYRDNLAH